MAKDGFYASPEWRELRYQALKLHGRKCQCCGAHSPNVILHVDHVKPRSKYPELELDIDNLQVLCEDCNLGKMAKYEDDFRQSGDEESARKYTEELLSKERRRGLSENEKRELVRMLSGS